MNLSKRTIAISLLLLPFVVSVPARAAPAELTKLLEFGLEALRKGGQFESLPGPAKALALRKLLALQGVEVPQSIDLRGTVPALLSKQIYKGMPADRLQPFEAQLQAALRFTTVRKEAASTPNQRTYRIGARDILAVNIFTQNRGQGETDSTLDVPVNSQGFIALPLVGKIRAEGQEPGDLEQQISKQYRRFVKDPQVAVHVREYRSQRVFVVGEVQKNGPIALEHENTTLFEVISRAGGFVAGAENTPDGADARNIVIQRGTSKIRVDFYGEATDTNTALDFFVADGDQIFVPKPLHRVRVLGGVNSAGEFPLRPGMTLLDAITMAGSFTEKSRRDQVRIISGDGGRENTRYVDATKIFHGRAKEIPLRPDDIVYVSEW